MKNLTSRFLVFLIVITNIFCSEISSQITSSEKNGTRTIYLIRHGEYNQVDTSDSDLGKELTPLGIAQARLLSARLKTIPVKFNSLTSSSMIRALQTAQIINYDFPELELEESNLIRECTPPTWRKDIMEEADSLELFNCVENLEKAFKEFFITSPDTRDRNDIIVCHGNVIRYFVTKVLKANPMSWLQMSIGNCSLTIIRVLPDGSFKLASFSDMGHIPPNLQTETGGNNSPKELIIQEEK